MAGSSSGVQASSLQDAVQSMLEDTDADGNSLTSVLTHATLVAGAHAASKRAYTDRQGTPNGQRSEAIRRARHIHTSMQPPLNQHADPQSALHRLMCSKQVHSAEVRTAAAVHQLEAQSCATRLRS